MLEVYRYVNLKTIVNSEEDSAVKIHLHMS